ncbi:MAG: site-specific DNA-methyltransferase [Tenericutes bacterium]|nr:site-specific DNA-methyltransferase [Mycoplasmatota bacterium]
MEKMDGYSFNVLEDNLNKMKRLFPEVFTEGKIDFDKLQEILGEYIEDREEKYNFTWNGKSKAIRLAQTPSTGTLRPVKDESKDWDTTQNLYIEGDNLEVLKLLQKTYHGRIKMIYIDPPYNTGKDFVYKDDYKDNLKNYLKITGQTDDEGKKVGTNSEVSGRYHTDWLNMMYPRLRLARNLLCDDGVIFISIDDNEAHNLRKICDEIFGEDNFVGTVTWEKRTKAQNTVDAKNMFQSKTEYIFLYKKNTYKIRFNLESSGSKEYNEVDDKGEFRFKVVEEMSAIGMRGRETMVYPILGVMPGKDKQWKIGLETINSFIDRDDILIIDGRPTLKIRPTDEDSKSYFPFWSHFFEKDAYGTAEVGKSELTNILNTPHHNFETVKPTKLIKKLAFHVQDMSTINTNRPFIILDFFAGSSTTAHAVMQLNAEDGGNRKFIMVQLPEKTDEKSEAYKAGYKTITKIGKERIRKAGEKIKEDFKDNDGIEDLDVGFKTFRLDSSNIKEWNPNFDNLVITLEDMVDNFVPERSEEDLLYEIMIKYGIDITVPIEEHIVDNKKIYSIGMGILLVCLSNEIGLDIVSGIKELLEIVNPEKKPRVVFKDNGFEDDATKTNVLLMLKKHGIEEVVSI